MIAVDTNVLVRAFLNDDPVQSPESARVIEQLANGGEGLFVTLSVTLELVWTLKVKKQSLVEIYEFLRHLIESDGVTFAGGGLVSEALEIFRQGKIDFGDCMLLAECQAAGVGRVTTYDGDLLKADKRALTVVAVLK